MSRETHSSVTRLPKEIREEISRLREDGRTLDEIIEHLRSLKLEEVPSRSSLGRYTKRQARVREEVTRSRVLAEAVCKSFGSNETSKVARTNIELLHGALMKLMVGNEEGEAQALSSKDVMMLGKALADLSKASKSDVEETIKVRLETERRQTVDKAAEAAVSEAKKQGLSTETVDAIKKRILGI